VIVNVAVAVFWVFGLPTLASKTSTVKVDDTLVLPGVPVMAPASLLSFNPLGNFPEVSFHLYGALPFAAANEAM
jgi:hypothetical protein